MPPKTFNQCTVCVMDTSDPQISFDHNGQCNHCRDIVGLKQELQSIRKYGAEFLNERVVKILAKGKGKKYDAVLGISGGVDSAYLAYLCKNMGLRLLLVHMDNGWNSSIANKNIQRLAKFLEFDYECVVLDWEQFRDIQLAFLKASVVEAETPTDMAIAGVLHRVAAKHGVKTIISGGNIASEGILPYLWHYNSKDMQYFKHIVKKYGNGKWNKFPSFGWKRETYYKFIKGIQIEYLLNFISFDKTEAKKFLIDAVGFEDYGGKHHESIFTRYIQGYFLVKKYDLDYRKATLSSMICAGFITRDEALEILKKPAYDEQKVAEEELFIAKKLGLSVAEFRDIVALPSKYYYHYPNSEKSLKSLYTFYRKVFQSRKQIANLIVSGNLINIIGNNLILPASLI